MTYIFETFKVKKNVEDNPEEISERLVNVKDLVSARLSRKNKRIDDLIQMQQEKMQAAEDMKLQGLTQVDLPQIARKMAKDPNNMAKVWRSIKDVDDDKNGFLKVDELEACFREHFAPALEGKSMVHFCRQWSTDHDKDMINYRPLKEAIMEWIQNNAPQRRPSPEQMRKSSTTANLHTDLIDKINKAPHMANKKNALDSFTNKPLKADAGILRDYEDTAGRESSG